MTPLTRSCVFTGLALITGTTLAAGDVASGEAVYNRWCTHCHDTGNEHPGTMALAAKYKGSLPAPLADRTDMTPEFVHQFVRKGVSIMPFFRKTEISDRELEDLAAYLTRNNK